jgi:hypothetical protein
MAKGKRRRRYADGRALGVWGHVEAPGAVPRQEYADGNALGVGDEYADGLALSIVVTMDHMATDTPTAMPSAYIGPDFFYFADLLF